MYQGENTSYTKRTNYGVTVLFGFTAALLVGLPAACYIKTSLQTGTPSQLESKIEHEPMEKPSLTTQYSRP